MRWEPIETAPKDGSRILGYDPSWWDDPICVISWGRGNWLDWSGTNSFRDATHWMPLPEQPK